MVICPKPIRWHEIFKDLEQAWELTGNDGSPPPKPLILAGWNYSNDIEKKSRWEETINWARENKLEYLIPQIADGDLYIVDNPIAYTVGPMGGPLYLPWDYTSKNKPSPAEVDEALKKLKENWEKIVGRELSLVTKPLRFTGKKQRRLLVLAEAKAIPPWGTWAELYWGNQRHSFTVFRKAVNDAIHPVFVDHIDFQTVEN